MPRRRRPDLGRRSQSNVRRATSRANRTDDQRQTDQENSRIAMSELRSSVSDNVGDRLRMQRVRAHQTQQQQARHNEIDLRVCTNLDTGHRIPAADRVCGRGGATARVDVSGCH